MRLNQTAVVGQDTALNIFSAFPSPAVPLPINLPRVLLKLWFWLLAKRLLPAIVPSVLVIPTAERVVSFGGFNTPGLVVERTCLRGDVDRVLHRTDGARLIVDLARRQDDLPIGLLCLEYCWWLEWCWPSSCPAVICPCVLLRLSPVIVALPLAENFPHCRCRFQRWQ